MNWKKVRVGGGRKWEEKWYLDEAGEVGKYLTIYNIIHHIKGFDLYSKNSGKLATDIVTD